MTEESIPEAEREAMAHSYEVLRSAALVDGLASEAPLGLALFLRRGMVGWLDARRRIEPAIARQPARQVVRVSLPMGAVAAELTHVLVSMALGAVGRSCNAT